MESSGNDTLETPTQPSNPEWRISVELLRTRIRISKGIIKGLKGSVLLKFWAS